MGWFNSVKNPKLKSVKKVVSHTPVGLWKKCSGCEEILQTEKLVKNNNVCPFCEYHYRLTAFERINLLIDSGTFKEFSDNLKSLNPLEFQDKLSYEDRLNKAYQTNKRFDGTIVGEGKVEGSDIILAVMDFHFMGGSMGVVTGEKISLAMDMGLKKKKPVVVISSSGGARMQEGILSLMQMAKTSAARSKLKDAGIPYISILTDPTTGGCAASFSMLGDVNIAEPNALIGFAGPRVIEQTIHQTLPSGFQRSEFLLERGFIDRVVHRKNLKAELSFFIKMFS